MVLLFLKPNVLHIQLLISDVPSSFLTGILVCPGDGKDLLYAPYQHEAYTYYH